MEQAPTEFPNQRLKILIPGWTFLILSTLFVTWRVIYGIQTSRKFMVCDYLLIIAACLNITASAINQVVVDAGMGRHIYDPSVQPTILRFAYFLWIDQIINILAVAFLKLSICAWLLALKFSKAYMVVVWLSLMMVLAVNLLAPVINLFGCTPLEKNWNVMYQGPGHCWTHTSVPLAYTQGISNVITDIIYMAAPLIYLWSVQLSRRTQLGIRIVFLLSIPVTVCSIFKTIELKNITETVDPTWTGVDLTIWSQTEASLGILIASLPPLRKAFDSFFKKILPSSMKTSNTPQYGDGYGYGHNSTKGNIKLTSFRGSKAYASRLPGEESAVNADDDSDRAILEGSYGILGPITKTTQVSVSEDTKAEEGDKKGESGLGRHGHGWDSPRVPQQPHHAR